MAGQIIAIVADDRERASGIIDQLREIPGIEVHIEHLSLGDFVGSGQIVFERTRADDFRLSTVVFSVKLRD